LRINVDDYIVPVGEEITTPTEPRPPAGKGPRRLRPAEPFYPVPKRWLTSRAMDEVFDIRARLAIFLWNESRFGSRPVRFTWDKAAELGIARNRTRELRRLAAIGLIQIEMAGRTPTVTLPADSLLHQFGANQDEALR